MVFKHYANYYDLLYADKDYESECEFLEELFHAHSKQPVSQILDLGCGTGGHAIPLAQRGYKVTGVDYSSVMIASAKKKRVELGVDIDLQENDLRSVTLDSKFNIVLAMFAVLGYQISDTDVQDTFHTARRHLDIDGLFIFDTWYGPAVLAQHPSDRIKSIPIQNDEYLLRLAQPSLDELNHLVYVDYTLYRLSAERIMDKVHEVHTMRFFFQPEIRLICQMTNFELVHVCPFMQPERLPSAQDWNVTWIARAR